MLKKTANKPSKASSNAQKKPSRNSATGKFIDKIRKDKVTNAVFTRLSFK